MTSMTSGHCTAERTFTANGDDCVRLWVNNHLLFDKWGQC